MTSSTNLDRHHSWEDGTHDADLAAITDELKEDLHVKEELCNDEVCSSVNLLLQMQQVLLVRWTVRMTGRITLSRQISDQTYLTAYLDFTRT